jgi:succinate dehydrogenase / fumarate reductase flavoprotein subunit
LESNFSDHGANRLGASALMQGLADGYFVPYTIGDYLAQILKRVKSQQTYLNLKKLRKNVKRVLNVLSQIMVRIL